ncbi:MAG: hypothetical protein R3F46_12340 [bacterium]
MQAEQAAGGKPDYTMDALRELDNLDLQRRVERIDNRMAQRIARQLWEEFHRMWSVDHPEGTQQYRSLQFTQRRELLILHAELQRLRGCSFGAMVLEAPQLLRERWDELPALLRLLLRPPAGLNSEQAGRDLLDYSELLTGQSRGIPGVLVRSALRWGSILCLVVIPLLALLASRWNGNWLILMVAPGILYTFAYMAGIYRVESRQYMLALALFISFTDEFVERHQDGEWEYPEPTVV